MINLKDQVITELGIPNKKGHIYPLDVTTRTLERLGGNSVLGLVQPIVIQYDQVDSEAISHYAHNLRIVDRKLLGDIQVVDTARGVLLQHLLKKTEVAFRPLIRHVCAGKDRSVISYFDIVAIVAMDAKQAA